jgi:hypothetical protein
MSIEEREKGSKTEEEFETQDAEFTERITNHGS